MFAGKHKRSEMLYNGQTTMKNFLITSTAIVALATTGFAQSSCACCNPNDAFCKNELILAQSTQTDTVKQSGGVSAQSQTVEITSTRLNLMYLRDGYDNFAAFALPLYSVDNTNGRLKLNTFGAFDPSHTKKRVYVGTGISFDVFDEKGWKFTAFGGVKGFNVADNFKFQDGNRGWVYGFGITIPFATK
jgi:hypothetical protein